LKGKQKETNQIIPKTKNIKEEEEEEEEEEGENKNLSPLSVSFVKPKNNKRKLQKKDGVIRQ
jgi:hypothetical protein